MLVTANIRTPKPTGLVGCSDSEPQREGGPNAQQTSPLSHLPPTTPSLQDHDPHGGLTHSPTLGALLGVAAQTEACNLLISLLATNWPLSDPLICCYSIVLNPPGARAPTHRSTKSECLREGPASSTRSTRAGAVASPRAPEPPAPHPAQQLVPNACSLELTK